MTSKVALVDEPEFQLTVHSTQLPTLLGNWKEEPWLLPLTLSCKTAGPPPTAVDVQAEKKYVVLGKIPTVCRQTAGDPDVAPLMTMYLPVPDVWSPMLKNAPLKLLGVEETVYWPSLEFEFVNT